jgi:DNA-directed RNA polymerase I, II, and III subunit RPABC2
MSDNENEIDYSDDENENSSVDENENQEEEDEEQDQEELSQKDEKEENIQDEEDDDNDMIEDDEEEKMDDDSYIEEDENNDNKKKSTKMNVNEEKIMDDDDDEYDSEEYLQKFNSEVNKNYILDFHPECFINNYDEINTLTKVIRDDKNNIIDDIHRTLPYLTKYEKARIIGHRAKQINSGAKVFVKVPENIIDGYLIAEMELKQKRIPFIIRRPIPSGGCEYWNLRDLEIIDF